MRKASALSRLVVPLIAVGVLSVGCGQTPATPEPLASSKRAVAPVAEPGEPVAAGSQPKKTAQQPDPSGLPVGSTYRNPANGRDEVIVADIRLTAVLIGDSQSQPADGWPRQALAALGYKVHFAGLGGTGFVAANGKTGNYIDALQRGDWLLPYGAPPLVVIQGGGNDATRGATDAQIVANADRLIAALKQRYPGARIVMIGTLARGANYGGGRRSQVDALLGTVAAKDGLTFISVGDWLTRYDAVKELADGVHMTAAGHKKLGAVLTREMGAAGLAAPQDSGRVSETGPPVSGADATQ